MNSKIAIGVPTLVAVGILFIYYWLGGFNPLEIRTMVVNNYYVAGRYFEGAYKSDTMANYFMETKQMIEEGQLEGILTLIYYQEPLGRRGLIKSFVGVNLADTSITLPSGFEWRQIEARQVVQAKVHAHVAVMSNPETIKESIRDHAKKEGLKLASYSIERYLSDWEVITEIPIVP